MLSILIPIYNYEVTALVNTLYPQAENSGIPFEIILLDDCSTSQEIIAKNKKLEALIGCSYFSNKKNKGRTFTRNFLAEKAQYQWLLFLDADVIPQSKNFIKNFHFSSLSSDIVFGGVTYSKTPPKTAEMLRWKYGKAREDRCIKERNEKPYLSLISGCCLIKKVAFLKANNHLDNVYGADVLFAQNLEKMHARVEHIDNPVIHYGLETNRAFIEKTKKGLKTLADFSKNGKIPDNYRPIQKAYLRLKKYRLTSFFVFCVGNLNSFVLKNLNSKNPSLFLFDLYRLYYYAGLNK